MDLLVLFGSARLSADLQANTAEIKKYFELEPLARGKRWVLAGSSVDNMEAVKESFSQLIGLLEEKETEPGQGSPPCLRPRPTATQHPAPSNCTAGENSIISIPIPKNGIKSRVSPVCCP
ncbi:hypothetical protein SKAU_G00012360 [Synaphobranchus kaupii]|uniref:Uncharacterized protein n=1 Tax=Synaphobranchus kaupii TaxID=118154 RepID=A0A9Q1JCB0_SYNKA|nr:hypothetical protein SKAU_G00012360 [Synaphobranchus kaupii]